MPYEEVKLYFALNYTKQCYVLTLNGFFLTRFSRHGYGKALEFIDLLKNVLKLAEIPAVFATCLERQHQ